MRSCINSYCAYTAVLSPAEVQRYSALNAVVLSKHTMVVDNFSTAVWEGLGTKPEYHICECVPHAATVKQ